VGRSGVPFEYFGVAELQRVQGRVGDFLIGVGQRDSASRLSCGQLVLEDVCGLLLRSRVVDPLASKKHRMLFHSRVDLFARRAGQPPEAVEVLESPSRSKRLAVRVEHRRVELTPRREGARGEVGKPSRVPVRGWTLELLADDR
jgi:hypothetical protein